MQTYRFISKDLPKKKKNQNTTEPNKRRIYTLCLTCIRSPAAAEIAKAVVKPNYTSQYTPLLMVETGKSVLAKKNN